MKSIREKKEIKEIKKKQLRCKINVGVYYAYQKTNSCLRPCQHLRKNTGPDHGREFKEMFATHHKNKKKQKEKPKQENSNSTNR